MKIRPLFVASLVVCALLFTAATPTYYGNLNVPAGGTATLTGVASQCLQTNGSGVISGTGGTCSTGTVTGLTAGSNIVVGTGPTPTVAVTNAPTFTGQVGAASFSAGSGNTIYGSGTITGSGSTLTAEMNTSSFLRFILGSSATNWGVLDEVASDGTTTEIAGEGQPVSGVTGTKLNIYGNYVDLVALDTSGDMGVKTNLAIGGTLTGATTIAASGLVTSSAGFQISGGAGVQGQVYAFGSNTVLQGYSGGTGGIILATSTGTPVLNINGATGLATFNYGINTTNVTDSALTSGTCTEAGTSGILQNTTTGTGHCGVVGVSKSTLVVERFISGALTVAGSVAFPLPNGATTLTVSALNFQCTTPGTSGTNTVQWQYTTTGDPTSASWTSITGATQSWTTAGGVVPSTFTGVNLTTSSVTWVRANITAVGAGPPSNCYLYLHGTQTIQ